MSDGIRIVPAPTWPPHLADAETFASTIDITEPLPIGRLGELFRQARNRWAAEHGYRVTAEGYLVWP